MDGALNYSNRVLDIRKELRPMVYTEIINELDWIGFVWSQKQSYDRAIEFYDESLRVSETNFPPGELSIVSSLCKLGEVQRTQHRYEHSLAYELKCFLIREKVLPPNHQDIGNSLNNIGVCYEHLNQRKLALDYYRRALDVYQQYSSSTQQDRLVIELKIEELSIEMNQINI
jgi:tetratricopeptide (TPR) repeat protein